MADGIATVAAAVRVADGEAAWHAGEHLVSYLVTELARVRLQRLAVRHAGEAGLSGSHGSEALAEKLRSTLRPTLDLLEDLAVEVAATFASPPTAAQLDARVSRAVQTRLGAVDELVHGFGFMAEVGVVPQAPYWLRWWQRNPDHVFDRDYSHQLDPRRDDFYDYATKSYMIQPRETRRTCAVGPYIDYGGVDDYLVTVSVPVGGSAFLGIVAADIRVASLERVLSPWLAQAEDTCVVVNGGRRVLLSNSIRYHVGDVLPEGDDLALSDAGCFGWLIGRCSG